MINGNDGSPFLGVPKASLCIETPDGVYQGSPDKHSLYNGPLNYPLIPSDYDFVKTVKPDYQEL